MKIIAFNGSPRKNQNTATLLNKALEGAASQGAETELVHLYNLNYKGCISCFACKLKGGKSYGHCSINDDLKPIFEKVEQADALIFGSPIYFGSISGEMRSFLERLHFQYLEYKENYPSLFNRKIKTGFIYSMNVTNEMMKEMAYEQDLKRMETYSQYIFGSSESLYVYDTFQFSDYSKYVSSLFDPEKKARIQKEVFPIDCQKAYEMGRSFVKNNKTVI